MILAIALIVGGAFGVVIFAFLSWRVAGGSQTNPNSLEVARQAPKHFQWAGRACAVLIGIGILRLFTR